ncbi:hypothetical protein [Streptomyces sp. NPDC088725]|uniref:hypothetical protein n=1 Tax=Streptomyces sp. NPDC088725 TaxID=3365873 RepID=UPI003828F5EA
MTAQRDGCWRRWSRSRPRLSEKLRTDTNDCQPDDQAALLSIAGGARVHENLLTGLMSVSTASGARIPYAQL